MDRIEPGASLRWGILGAAVIARKFWQAVRLSGVSTITGIASRSADRAVEFVNQLQARFPVSNEPCVFSDYRSLIESDRVDAVYVPLPTGLRSAWVIEAAKNGKHVLCEKPCAVTNSEMQGMIEACASAGVQFMDNVMFMHSARTHALRKLLHVEKRIGAIQRVATQFSFLGDEPFFQENIRNQVSMEPWGCLGDLGWYCIRICLLAMNDELPIAVRGKLLQPSSSNVPAREFSGELYFSAGRTASLYCSFLNQHQQWVHFSGTQGNFWVDDFVLPWFGNRLRVRERQVSFNESGFDFNYECHGQDFWYDEYGNGHPSAQEVQLVRKFVELTKSPDTYWPQIAQKAQHVMQALWDSAVMNKDVEVT
ncbi:MAG: Gfo/Idh/MocA family oxidoreductase [Planctomycetaceae bacterium]|nr:Gfo/Idh/MocA family oxidoreductase [Planctomycetaceae bacterium]